MGTVIPLFTKNAEPIAKPYGCSSLRLAIRNMEDALSEQADVFAEYKETTEKLEKVIKSIEMNYVLFGQALEEAQENTRRLRKRTLRLWTVMDDSQNKNQQLQRA